MHTKAGVTSLYVAFNGGSTVGGQTSQGALRWSSAGWSRIIGRPVRSASSLAVHDDGSGHPRRGSMLTLHLYVAGPVAVRRSCQVRSRRTVPSDAGRLRSVLTLDIADLDLEGHVVTLREVTGGGSLEVFLRADLTELLAAWIGDRRRGPLFVGRDGDALTPRHAQRSFDEWLAKAGIRGRYSPHSLLHTFAMGLYARTGDVLVVQAALGHRSIASTLVYARASAERVRAAVVG